MDLEDLPQPEFDGVVPTDELSVDGDNPNEQSEEMFGLLRRKLHENGWLGGPIVADSNGVIADGEHRWRAARAIGLEEVPVRKYDIDDSTRRLWRQELNKISGEHDPKRDALEYDRLLQEGHTDDVRDLVEAADEDLDELLAEIHVSNAENVGYEYDVDHSVHYEDCVAGMREHLEDDSVDCVVTDPPYGVDLDLSGTMGATDVGHAGSLANDGYDEATDLWRRAVYELKRVLRPDGHLYAFASWRTFDVFRDALAYAGFDVLNCIVWLKSTPNNQTAFGSGGRRYGYQHEFILYAVHQDGDARPLDRTLADAILHTHRTQDNQHPTEKPVGLLETLIEQSTDAGDVVLDPFLGSGSTAVAALQTGRDVIGFELDEAEYRSVIERRIGEAERTLAAGINSDSER